MQRHLRALTSMAPRDVLVVSAANYPQGRAISIEVQSAGGVEVARRVMAGEAADIVVLASDAIDKLIAADKLASGRIDLMRSEIAVGIATGAAKPDLTDEVAIRQLLLRAASLSYSTGPSGQYLEKLFTFWGIGAQIRPKIKVPAPGVAVARLIADGEVELGFQQLSELIHASGVEVAGLLPDALQHTTIFSAAVSRDCQNPEVAWQFLRYVQSAEADHIRLGHGMRGVT